MKDKTFSVSFLIHVDKKNNILGAYDDAHEDDIHDLITDTFYDIDDVKVDNIRVKERDT
jgi:hypothetical protein|tara:strand:- start:1004 stop:1180 length:177 start_codon:yes stop_codon:yes gene_type:complete